MSGLNSKLKQNHSPCFNWPEHETLRLGINCTDGETKFVFRIHNCDWGHTGAVVHIKHFKWY